MALISGSHRGSANNPADVPQQADRRTDVGRTEGHRRQRRGGRQTGIALLPSQEKSLLAQLQS